MPVRLPFRPRRDAYPSDLWTKCPGCTEMLFNKQLDKTLRVCPHCGHHFRIPAKLRIAQLLDAGSFVERDANLAPIDSLNFVDLKPYPDRLIAAQLSTGLKDAAIWGIGAMGGKPVSICVMDFGFIGGSMGAVVGEKVTRAGEAALEQRIPLIIVAMSGGARMQEGTFALMQLVKTMGAVERVKAAGVPFISLMTDPTTGGVFASFAVVGDVNLTEPNALIRFAGDRVSSGTIGEELPSGYARAEFWLSHGFVDRIVPRSHMRDEIIAILSYVVPVSAAGSADTAAAFVAKPRSFLSALTGVLTGDNAGDNKSGEAPRG
ncbi:MAG TPA: acetyl-CoA carboxylase, carboxyltransferase subunit beta [Candidatus Limnocylindrales bacterium]